MTNDSQTDVVVDVHALREEVKIKYREVAADPHGKHHFHTGRYLAKHLGYDDDFVGSLPDVAVKLFAGVASPFALRSLAKGERVVDVGSGAGFDFVRRRPSGGPDRTSRRRGHDAGDARQVPIDSRKARSDLCRVPRRVGGGFASGGRMGGRRHQQWRDQPMCRQEADLFGNLPGSPAGWPICNSRTSPTASRCRSQRFRTLTFGPLELPVVCRAQPGKKCWKTSGSLRSRSDRRSILSKVRAARAKLDCSKSTDIRSWRANRFEPIARGSRRAVLSAIRERRPL